MNERDKEFIDSLDEKLVDARTNQWEAKLNSAKRNKVFEIEDKISAVKERASRYKNLKFV